jgi:desulfoferrodoxin (superoxide reductase-like protein)
VSDVTEHVRRMEDRKTFKSSSTLKFMPSSSQMIKCSAHNDAFPAGKVSHAITMKIKGKPEVELQHLDDGESVQISCSKGQIKDNVRYKWFINDVELFAETENVLEIHQFSKSYDKSRIKCSMTGQKGQDEVIRVVELVHKLNTATKAKSFTNNPDRISNTEERLQRHFEVNRKIVKSQKTMFTCIVEEETTLEPKYVWIDGKLRMAKDEKMDATDGKRKYKCKVIPNGTKKMNRMSTNMKKISRTLRKFSKTLSSLSTTIDDT